MPIKLEDLTCERCIYSAREISEGFVVLACRRRSILDKKMVNSTYWCGDGHWPITLKGTKPLPVLIDRRNMYGDEVDDFEWREDA